MTQILVEENMDLQRLLEEWSEVEPERCQAIFGSLGNTSTFFIAYGQDEDLGWWNFKCGTAVKGHDARLLMSAIDAIEARGWDWNITSNIAGEHRYYGCVVEPDPDEGFNFVKAGHTPGEALLRAYLQALRLRGKRDIAILFG